MIWAVDALQTGRESQAASFLSYPIEAIVTEYASKFRIKPWTLETLLNEVLAVPKKDRATVS